MPKRVLPIFLIVFLGAACYSNAIDSDFVWDDKAFVIFNPAIRSLNNPIAFLTDRRTLTADEDMSNDVYHPLMALSLAIDYHFFKLNPRYYHFENALFHIFNALLFYFLLNAIFKNGAFSFVGALIFLAHPVQTEAVSWISGRADVLFLFFYLASFLSYVRYREAGGRICLFCLSLVLFVFGLFSKEMAATLPFVLVLYELYMNKDQPKWKSISKIGIYFAVLAAYMAFRYVALGVMSQRQYWGGSFYRTMLTMAKGVVYYIKILILPTRLCASYVVFTSKSMLEIYVLMSIIILSVLGGILIYASKSNKTLAFGIAFFFVTLLPVSNIFPLKFIIAERCLYLPSIGYAIVITSLILGFAGFLSRNRPSYFSTTLTVVLPALLIGSFAIRTYARNNVWKNEYALFTSITECSPYNSFAYHNLGNIYYDRGDNTSAIKFYKKAIELKPDYMYSHLGLGNALHNEKRYKEAMEEYESALRINPSASAYSSLGVLSFDEGNYEKAVVCYKKALALEKNSVNAYINLGNAYYKLGNIDAARKAWKKALKIEPGLKYIEENLAALE